MSDDKLAILDVEHPTSSGIKQTLILRTEFVSLEEKISNNQSYSTIPLRQIALMKYAASNTPAILILAIVCSIFEIGAIYTEAPFVAHLILILGVLISVALFLKSRQMALIITSSGEESIEILCKGKQSNEVISFMAKIETAISSCHKSH